MMHGAEEVGSSGGGGGCRIDVFKSGRCNAEVFRDENPVIERNVFRGAALPGEGAIFSGEPEMGAELIESGKFKDTVLAVVLQKIFYRKLVDGRFFVEFFQHCALRKGGTTGLEELLQLFRRCGFHFAPELHSGGRGVVL